MGIEKFLGIGIKGGGEISEMGDEVMQDVMKELKPLFDRIGKPFLKPAFAEIEAELGQDDKFMMLRYDKKTKMVVFWILDSKLTELKIIDAKGVVKCMPIKDPVEFMEKLMSGQLIKTKEEKKAIETTNEPKQLGEGK